MRKLQPSDRLRSVRQTMWTVVVTLAFGSLLLVFSGDGRAPQGAGEATAPPPSPSRQACPIVEVPSRPECPKTRLREEPLAS